MLTKTLNNHSFKKTFVTFVKHAKLNHLQFKERQLKIYNIIFIHKVRKVTLTYLLPWILHSLP